MTTLLVTFVGSTPDFPFLHASVALWVKNVWNRCSIYISRHSFIRVCVEFISFQPVLWLFTALLRLLVLSTALRHWISQFASISNIFYPQCKLWWKFLNNWSLFRTPWLSQGLILSAVGRFRIFSLYKLVFSDNICDDHMKNLFDSFDSATDFLSLIDRKTDKSHLKNQSF